MLVVFVHDIQPGVLLHIFEHTSSWTFTFALLFCMATLISINHLRVSNSRIPLYEDGQLPQNPKKAWAVDAMHILRRGHKKFGSKPFQVVTTEGNAVILPSALLDEVKMKSDNELPSWLGKYLQSKHTGLGGSVKPKAIVDIVQLKLNNHLASVFPDIREEVKDAMSVELPTCEDWTPLKLYVGIARVVCRVSGRVFVGTKLNRNEEWIRINFEYTRNIFTAAAALRSYPSPLRWVIRYFLPEMKIVRAQHKLAEKILRPIIMERNKAEKLNGYEPPKDTIEWTRDVMQGAEKENYHLQTLMQLGIGAAAIHTTSQTVLAIIYNLATYPKYQTLLRAEAKDVREANGGAFTLESLGQLKKLDSFMKESQRMDPLGVISVQRQALKPFTLSDGTQIPKNTIIMGATEALASDPINYMNPDVFDGLRFYNLSQESLVLEKRSQFASTSKTHLHFGTGRHACPGRWFASHEIKLIVSEFIQRFDARLEKGEDRPMNLRFQHMNIPNPNGEILLKSRMV